MHFLFKFIIVLCTVAIVLTLFTYIGSQIPTDETRPQGIQGYHDVIPAGFAAQEIQRVLDPRDAGRIMNPTPQTAQVAQRIITVCQTPNTECHLRAIVMWQRTHIEHTEVIQVRDHVLTPEETLLFREGDDLALSVLLVSMLRSQDIDARIGRTPYSTFVEATLNKEPLRIDLGCANCGLGSIRYRGSEETILWIA